jgi:hypothetical protein
MTKIFMIRIESTHHETDEETKWEETKKALERAARENFYRAEVTVDEIKVA